jgi:hypothetical protein
MEVDGYTSMMGKAKKVVSQDEGELWHRRLGHLHHGALKILQQISTWNSNENTFSVRLVQGLHHGEVCKFNLS